MRERDLPFYVARLCKGDAKAFYLIASQFRIGAYVNLGLRLRDWRDWLANHGPVLTRLDCDDTWMDAKSTAGVLAEYHADTAEGGHAVALVGYDEDRFIVRNSWDTTWGYQSPYGGGYGTIPYQYITNDAWEAVTAVVPGITSGETEEERKEEDTLAGGQSTMTIEVTPNIKITITSSGGGPKIV